VRPDAVAAGDVAAVRYLQRVPAATGQPTVVTGHSPTPRRPSLQAFQRVQGLPDTGVLDAATMRALTRSRQTK